MADIQFRMWLLRHEEDIALDMDDYGDLVNEFVSVIGRQPLKEPELVKGWGNG